MHNLILHLQHNIVTNNNNNNFIHLFQTIECSYISDIIHNESTSYGCKITAHKSLPLLYMIFTANDCQFAPGHSLLIQSIPALPLS